ncbi:hypothetical protein QTO34_014228 [Cnephaeus nilssonii]|uniref:Uncharacterized protein n=1 Tax=Cnephaeus nilssonii TaxID=3371016 RepID=A0AA40I607_CNENI|nr:hypothetical protein QTO34_014228 [Eptesicus nilssonii]
MVQTLSSRRHWRRELRVLLAQSATRATLSPAPCASCWPNRDATDGKQIPKPFETKIGGLHDVGPGPEGEVLFAALEAMDHHGCGGGDGSGRRGGSGHRFPCLCTNPLNFRAVTMSPLSPMWT